MANLICCHECHTFLTTETGAYVGCTRSAQDVPCCFVCLDDDYDFEIVTRAPLHRVPEEEEEQYVPEVEEKIR